VRRLLALTTALMFLELVFFTVLSPLLPELKHELALSTSQAGVLVAMYAVGCAVGAIPALMIVVRLGVHRTAIVSLATFATMSVLFGLAHGYDALLAARFVQGLAGAACWTAAMLWLLEVPLACFIVAPEWTPVAIDRAKAWVSRHAHRFAIRGLTVLGVLLIIKGIVGLVN